jgi:DNA-binding transcriptional MerR regulator
MKIGDLAKRAGVNIQTIRFYEREMVLRQPTRTASGYRLYTDHDLDHVIFVKECQHLGFTLKEIKELADLHDLILSVRPFDGNAPKELERITAIAADRLRTIDEKIDGLQQMRVHLLRMVQTLPEGQCPARERRTAK